MKTKKEESGNDESDKENAKRELETYIHYFERYINHDRALKFAEDDIKSAEKRVLRFQTEQAGALVDSLFLKQAVEQVIECRRVLKNTYIYGYFISREDNQQKKTLFEYQQQMLEMHTEKLHGYTEKNIEKVEKAEVMNLTAVGKHFLEKLLESLLNPTSSEDLYDSGSSSFANKRKELSVP